MATSISRPFRWVFMSLTLTCALAWLETRPDASASEQTLRSFGGIRFKDGQGPGGRLIQSVDGAMYGVTSNGGADGQGTIFKADLDGTGYAVVHQFDGSADGSHPEGDLVQGVDGAFYGTTSSGGPTGYGTIFKVMPDGTDFVVLHSFEGDTNLVVAFRYTSSSLMQGRDGVLYGTACSLYAANQIFKLNPDGTGFQILGTIASPRGEQVNPGLLQGADGGLYGVTQDGGAFGMGTIYRLKTDGTEFEVLYDFGGVQGDAAHPQDALIQAAGGKLYGTTGAGGANALGTVFEINPDGTGYQVIYSLDVPSFYGAGTQQGLLLAADGMFYSTTFGGGDASGAVFRLDPEDDSFELLHSFSSNADDGEGPGGALIQASDGDLYGTTYHGGTTGLGTIFTIKPDGSAFQVIHSFGAVVTNGTSPQCMLVQAQNGAMFGVASGGGSNGHGTVFTIGPDGTGYRELYSFGGAPEDGLSPRGGLTLGLDGAAYGTTYSGGAAKSGTVFKLNEDGSGFRLLHSFGNLPDGARPEAALLRGGDGRFYGTCAYGGISNSGTVFGIGSDGSGYSLIHSFGSLPTDGASPFAGLVQGVDGTLYGTTYSGGSKQEGTVFEVKPDGSGYAVLHDFGDSSEDGGFPAATLTRGADGTLYGTTLSGGTNGLGTVFRLNPDGAGYKVLHSFGLNDPDGAWSPRGGLVLGTDGSLYGTTEYGGAHRSGILFRLGIAGSDYTVIHDFGSTPDDARGPQSALLQGADGGFYGATSSGGADNLGAVFRVAAPPAPPPSRFLLSITPAVGGGFHISLLGDTGLTYSLEASTNLADWVLLGTALNDNGYVDFLDSNKANLPRRFYRVISSP